METETTSRLFTPADILLPRDCDMSKWSVIACDQYTSEPEYWHRAEEYVGGSPSTLNLILPEYLCESEEVDSLIAKGAETARRYLEQGVFRTVPNSFVYVERTLFSGKLRRGIVGMVDLEAYDFRPGSKSPIRATEGVVESRLPLRTRLKEKSVLDLPHTLMLMDDPDGTVLDHIELKTILFEKLYDFELMGGGGSIRGWRVTGAEAQRIVDAVDELARRSTENGSIAIAVGDGNHALAAAKICWKKIREGLTEEERRNHPRRFALVELVNIQEESMEFEPINRVVYDTDPERLLRELLEFYPSAYIGIGEGHKICYVYGRKAGVITVPKSEGVLAIGVLGEGTVLDVHPLLTRRPLDER